ncbi:MAG: TRAP transporter substrate-binding protein [Rhodobacteraceae bacterium]|nr:TRAP transporter substrate-binding protein [Paracoccaceae bacterium]
MTRSIILAAGLAAFALPANAADLRIAVGCPPVDACADWVFAEDVRTRLAELGMAAEVVAGAALGRDPDVVDQMSQGLLEMALTNFVMVRQFEPMVLGFMTPYMFDDQAHMFRAIDEGSVVGRINESLEPEGLRLATLTGLGGPVGLFTSRGPVETIADLAPMRLRAIDRSQVALFEAWGTQGVVIDMAEFATSVQSGVVDGYFNPPIVPLMFQHTDMLKYYTEIAAGHGVRSALMSLDWYEGLSDAARGMVDDALAHATERNRAWTLAAEAGEVGALEARGVTVTRLPDDVLAEFRDRARGAWDELMPPEYIADFEALADATRE